MGDEDLRKLKKQLSGLSRQTSALPRTGVLAKQASTVGQPLAPGPDHKEELWLDANRRQRVAQEYLTYVGEAKEWIEGCLDEELPGITTFEESLRNGVYLAKLARFFKPDLVKRVFDENQEQKLNLRHSDNFNSFLNACQLVGLPKVFYFTLTDLYDRKNMPKVIYMIHALSLFLTKLGIAPKLERKKYKFTEEELALTSAKLGDIVLPAFENLAAQLDKETGGGKKSNISKLQGDYEAKASNVSAWIEEKRLAIQSRDLENMSEGTRRDLLADIKEVKSEQEKKSEEIQQLSADLEKIKELLEPENQTYSPPEWMRVEALRDNLGKLDAEVKDKEKYLRLQKEYTRLQKSKQELSAWVEEQALTISKKVADDSAQEELRLLSNFRETEKQKKLAEFEELQAALRNFEEEDPRFAPAVRQQKEDLERVWQDLETVETRYEEDLKFHIDVMDLKAKTSDSVKEFSKWVEKKIEELHTKDHQGKKADQLSDLIQKHEDYKVQEKAPKSQEFARIKEQLQEIDSKLISKGSSILHPTTDALEELQQLWSKLDAAEQYRERVLSGKRDLAVLKEGDLEEFKTWEELKIEELQARDFVGKRSNEVSYLIGDLELFKEVQRPTKAKDFEKIKHEYEEIVARLGEDAPEENEVEQVEELWSKIEKVSEIREEKLRATHRIAILEEDEVPEFKTWVQNKTQELQVRDYDGKNSKELVELIEEFQQFKAQEMTTKAQRYEKVKEEYIEMQARLAPEVSQHQVIEELEVVWAQIEKAEEVRGEKLKAKHQLVVLEEGEVQTFSSWAEAKISQLEARDFDEKNSKELEGLIEEFQEFRAQEKPTKSQFFEKLREEYLEIQTRLDPEVSHPVVVEEMEVLWAKVEKAEEVREERLKAKHHLVLMEEGEVRDFKSWSRKKIGELEARDFEGKDSKELTRMIEELEEFNAQERPLKKESYTNIRKEYMDWKCRLDPQATPKRSSVVKKMDNLWARTETSAEIRGEKLKAKKEMVLLEEGTLKDIRIWANEKIGALEAKDFAGKSSKELAELIEEFQQFKATEKPAKQSEFKSLKEEYLKFNSLFNAREFSEYSEISEKPEPAVIEEAEQLWAKIEKAGELREEVLKTKYDLAVMEEEYLRKSKELVDWVELQILKNNSRDFPKTCEECIQLIAQEDNFKRTEKVRMGEFKERLVIDLAEIAAKIKKEGHEEFILGEKFGNLGIEQLWLQLEKSESERATILAAEQVRLGDEERMQLLHDHEALWIKLQAIARGNEVRKKHREMLDYYKQNEDKIIKIQALWRGKVAGQHYRAIKKDNPPVGTIQKFLHLLDDSEIDFEEELLLEQLKQQAVMQIRENNEKEKAINTLDLKIALLIKNRTTLDEVVESTKKYLKKQKKEPEQDHGLKSLAKENRQKLESYQHLFYLLQVNPSYLASLVFQLKKRDNVIKFMETVVLTLYGYAQNDREEYLLLNLFRFAIELEVKAVEEPQDILLGNPIFIKLVVQYTRGAKERQFLRELLQPLITEILENKDLDLDIDPLSIYRNMIKDEESKTGEKSTLPYDVPRSTALENDQVMKIFVRRLKDYRAITEKFLVAIIASLPKLPYGLRYIASQLRQKLEEKFPNDKEKITKIIGNVLYYRYMNPAIVAPEGFDVIETQISTVQRKMLGEISKILQQISVGKLFEDDFFYLSALNDYITKAKARFYKFFDDSAIVQSPEEYFKIDKYVDFAMTKHPVIYISQEEIFSTHALLLENLDEVAPDKEDPLREILKDLGPPPEGSAEAIHRGAEMSLTLTNKFAKIETEDVAVKTLYVETKRIVLSIIRIQQGDNLLDILEKPVTANEEKLYSLQLETEKGFEEKEGRSKIRASISKDGIFGLTFKGQKEKALENLQALVEKGAISGDNKYQDILNAVAKDIKNKSRRRIQRKQELEKIKKTLNNLGEKTRYLEEQIKSYQEYVDACVAAMSENRGSKKGKKKAVRPFSQQYFHEQKLKKEGKEHKFGSFKYTADKLFEKGVLVDLVGVPASQRGKVSLTISSDEVGVFEIQGKFMGVEMDSMELRLDDLLQKQFDNIQVMTLFGTAKVNVNLLIYLLNKKFYH